MNNSKRKMNIENLKTWIILEGGYIHPSLIHKSVEGISGIYARDPISRNQKIVEIPPHLIINSEKFKNNKAINKLPLTNLIDQVVASLCYENSLGANSFFYPWIKALVPLEEFKSFHPYFSSEKELEDLHCLCPRIVETIKKFEVKVDNFMRLTKNSFSKEIVQWAYANYLSRAFDGVGLIPFCDMFNHNSSLGRGLIDDHSLFSKNGLEINDQVYISYGSSFDALELWIHFGFYDKKNPHIINCGNVKFPHPKIKLGSDSYYSEEGPNQKLIELSQSFNPVDESFFHKSLARSLYNEISIENLQSNSEKVNTCLRLLKDRAEILDSARSQRF